MKAEPCVCERHAYQGRHQKTIQQQSREKVVQMKGKRTDRHWETNDLRVMTAYEACVSSHFSLLHKLVSVAAAGGGGKGQKHMPVLFCTGHAHAPLFS